MPRPHKPRSVRHDPPVVYFKPAGIPVRLLEEVRLKRDELEAMRLADVEGLSLEETGKLMGVSRATSGRVLAQARRKVAEAIVFGRAIKVEGGVIETVGRRRARRRRGLGAGRQCE